MIVLQEIGKKYQKNKKRIEAQKNSIRQKIEHKIEFQTIKALKIHNHKVSQIHKNQQAIEMRLKRNNQAKTQIQKKLNIWTNIYEELNKSLKKAGDLAHYANFIEDQINQVCFQINPNNKGLIYKSHLQDLMD